METVNLGFYFVFLVEMVIKVVGNGICDYVRDNFNLFDLFIIIISTVELTITFSTGNFESSGGSALSAMRGFRLLRIFKLAKTWKKFQELLATIASTVKDIRNFSVLLMLFIFTYTLLGMEFFSHNLKRDGKSIRRNFDTFGNGLISIFIALTGDDWSTWMLLLQRNVGNFGIYYTVSLIIIGQFILLNLFLAILLKNFDIEVRSDKENAAEAAKTSDVSDQPGRCYRCKAAFKRCGREITRAEQVQANHLG